MTEVTKDVVESVVNYPADLAEENEHAETLSAMMACNFEEWLNDAEENGQLITETSMETDYSVDDTGLHQLDICINWREGVVVDEETTDEVEED